MPGPTGEENLLSHRGRGVFAAIAPWNFPLAIFMGEVTAALAAGNTVVAKPASRTPLIGSAAVRLLHEAGVPASALGALVGDGKAGAALVADPRIAGVVFTGSTDTAFAINRALAAKTGPIVPLIAETGGLNAMIVDATALGEQVADDVITSAFRSAGQRCSALRLLLVQEDVADHMIDLVRGRSGRNSRSATRAARTPTSARSFDREQLDKLAVHIADWQGKGAVLFSVQRRPVRFPPVPMPRRPSSPCPTPRPRQGGVRPGAAYRPLQAKRARQGARGDPRLAATA